ncbi:hypothetical protein MLD38_006820 [Melastoma candidum]|uniref:Uncharacterized protein n=1 Tax=Melastoma candidum TaxID=119954 RepID=A0ACB9RNT0_9MYRT|nr:hypothetical protein MLD38_006820 [Melastoma candidum]
MCCLPRRLVTEDRPRVMLRLSGDVDTEETRNLPDNALFTSGMLFVLKEPFGVSPFQIISLGFGGWSHDGADSITHTTGIRTVEKRHPPREFSELLAKALHLPSPWSSSVLVT